MTLLHLATVRAIHLPFGLAGLAGGALATADLGNTMYWSARGDMTGLAISTSWRLRALGLLRLAR